MQEADAATPSPQGIPLCVDLDGTLIRSDLLVESLFALLKQNPLTLFLLPLWLLQGKAYFKQQIADRVDLDITLLPYHSQFLAYLEARHGAGDRLILATASNIRFAEQVAMHLGIFHEVIASDSETNLSGRHKRERLVGAFGERGFDYAGNAKVDLEIWRSARRAILVNPLSGVREGAAATGEIERIFDDRQPGIRPYLRAVRLHQWLKNLLIFIPLLMAHKVYEIDLLISAGLAMLAFSLCASSVYLCNDLLDLQADRHHPTKRLRPFASGAIDILKGILLAPALLLAGFSVALILPVEFFYSLIFYFLGTAAYSLYLKRLVLLDVLVLAGLYTLRLIAGAAAVSVTPSFWLLAFSMFLFLSLALVKRYSELLLLEENREVSLTGRGYQKDDLGILQSFGSGSGYLAVLVLALYINSEQVTVLYTHPALIWLLCPLLLYWISRVWLLTQRNQLHEDPVVFAIEDRVSHWLLLLGLITLWAAV